MLAKFGLPFDKATPLVHFPKALKRLRNNAGPASTIILIALCVCVCVRVCVCVCVCVCVHARACACVCTNAYGSQTVDRTVTKFCLPPKTCVQVSSGTLLETLRPSEVVETRFVTPRLA